MSTWPFAKKILGAFLALAVLMLSTVIVSIFAVRSLGSHQQITASARSAAAQASDLAVRLQERVAGLRGFIISHNREHLKQESKARQDFATILQSLSSDPSRSARTSALLEQVRTNDVEYTRLVERAIKEPAKASWIMETLLRPRRLLLEQSVAELNHDLRSRLESSDRAFQDQVHASLRTISLLAGLKFLLLLGLGWLLYRIVGEEQRTLLRANESRDILAKAERRAAFLAHSGRVLTETSDPVAALAQVANLSVEWLANVCLIELVDGPGVLQPIALSISGTDRDQLFNTLHRDLPRGLGSLFANSQILQSGRCILAAQVEDPRLVALSVKTFMAVPLRARNRTLGVLLLFRTDSGAEAYDDASLQFANELAHQAALAVDNARLLQQAEEGLRMREELLATVAHDLKNPLTTIRMNSEILLSQQGQVQPAAEGMARMIRESSNQMQRLIHDLLDLTKIESGRIKLERHPYDADELITDSLKTLELQAKERGITLQKDIRPGEAVVDCDKDRVVQVLLNLIGNALKFTGKGGRVRIEAQATGEGVRFGVLDNGPGIPENELPHIFDRYWQAHGTGRGSAGLGLSIARGIVEAHGGRIWAESALHMGSRFFFTMPEARKQGLRSDAA